MEEILVDATTPGINNRGHGKNPPLEKLSDNTRKIVLHLSQGSIDRFVSLLQSGIRIQSTAGEPLAVFLEKLPGFTPDYIIDEVQTIFLDGTAIDDLQTPLTGVAPVVALSAAMPGLSGAIFRRNSIHAALRTATVKSDKAAIGSVKPLGVHLKLFNAIADKKGPLLLREGITIKSESVMSFLNARGWLFNHIRKIQSALDENTHPESLSDLLQSVDLLHITFMEEQ